MSKPGTPRDETHWYNIFQRTKVKNEKKKLFQALLESSNQLTLTVAEQGHGISRLTNTNEDLTRQLAAANDNVRAAIEAKARIKAKQSILKETLEILQKDHESINLALKQQISSLEDRNRDMTRDNEHVTQKVIELEQRAETFKDKMDKMMSENRRLIQEQDVLRQNIQAAEKATLEESLKCKMLQKEIECNEDLMKRTEKERTELQEQTRELKKMLFTTKQEKRDIEQELGCQNETLKFEVTMLSRTLQKTKSKIEKLEKDKEIIISYYQDKQLAGKTSTHDLVNNSIRQISLDEDELRTVVLPDYPQVEYLQNKVFSMESQIFNQSQLIQELSDIICGYDPSFSISHNPQLNFYLNSKTQILERDCGDRETNIIEDTSTFQMSSMLDEAYASMATEIDQSFTVVQSSSDTTMPSMTSSYHGSLDSNDNIKSDHMYPVWSSSSSSF